MRAQDLAPPRLSSPPPTEAATPAASPATSPSPAQARTPSERKSTERAESSVAPKLSAPRRDVLREPPVRAVEKHARHPRPSPTPAPQPRRRGASRPTFDFAESSWVTAATIRSLENRWEAAVKDHDENAVRDLLAPNFEATSANGKQATRARVVALVRRDKNVYRSARAHGMHVRSVDPQTAVVTGTSTESGLTADGKKFTVSRSFTDTWKQHDGRWRCTSSQIAARSGR
ncbi:MAG TPA: nuclear transport factor 2 family protein [Chthoniobacterales bacterium]